MALIDSGYYEQVRKALHQSIDTALLPDSTIEMDIYLGRAEREIAARIPDAQDLVDADGEDAQVVRNATVFWLAALLAPVVELVISEAIPGGGYRYERPEVNWKDRAELLMSAALGEIGQITAPDAGSLEHRPTFFTVATGRRGK